MHPDWENPPSARELANKSNKPMQIAGLPADVCPYCGCAMFKNKTQTYQTFIRRYVYCRNPSCKKKFISAQEPEKLVREIEEDDPEETEPVLRVRVG